MDIYFLLDTTGSMARFRNQLVSVPDKLIRVIEARTQDYRFGYGAFREKPINPMEGKDGTDYSFVHIQGMTKETGALKRYKCISVLAL